MADKLLENGEQKVIVIFKYFTGYLILPIVPTKHPRNVMKAKSVLGISSKVTIIFHYFLWR